MNLICCTLGLTALTAGLLKSSRSPRKLSKCLRGAGAGLLTLGLLLPR